MAMPKFIPPSKWDYNSDDLFDQYLYITANGKLLTIRAKDKHYIGAIDGEVVAKLEATGTKSRTVVAQTLLTLAYS